MKLAVAVGPWRPISELAASSRVEGKLGGDPPTEVLLFPNPKWVLADMTLVTDEESQRAILAEFRKRKIDIVFDYEHQTLEASENGIPAPASGWIRDLRADKQGLWATSIDWTEKGAGFIRAGEYRYYSPVAFYDDNTKRVLSLHSVALTNTPRTNNQTPLTARAAASLIEQFREGREEGMKKWIQIFASLLKKAATAKPGDLVADVEQLLEQLQADGAEPAGKDDKATIASSLGFVEASAADEVPEAVTSLLGLEKGAKVAKVKASILTLQNPSDVVSKADYDKIVASNKSLQEKIDGANAKGDLEKLIASNRSKLSPKLEERVRSIAAKSGLAEAQAIVEELPVLISASAAAATRDNPADTISNENVVVEVGSGELRNVEANSATVAASVRSIMKELAASGHGEYMKLDSDGQRYSFANEIRKQRELAATD